MIRLQEHDIIEGVVAPTSRLDGLSLVSWDKPMNDMPWGYYASFKIGAEWIDNKEALVVTTKRGMENIDFLGMFMTCFSSNLAVEEFSNIYTINAEQPGIDAPSLKGVVSPLIVLHFLGVVSRIKTLKKGYVHHCENLKKIKGRISILKNERSNVALKRFDRVYCNYDEYSVDIPENRVLKKALLFAQRFLGGIRESYHSYEGINHVLTRCLSLFESVSDDVEIKDIRMIKGHKIYKDYAEAIRLAKLVLRHFDYSINNVSQREEKIMPFVLDMSLLYEHYVYGLLYEAYKDKIVYQYRGQTGYPDFLYCSNGFKAILDTKYIPKYEKTPLDTYVVRQLSGYGRDISILRRLGYDDLDELSVTPSIPCIIIYPVESGEGQNPFVGRKIIELCGNRVRGLSQFYKIPIPLPTVEP